MAFDELRPNGVGIQFVSNQYVILKTMSDYTNALEGCLLGCAVGDSIGLPCEGISPQRINKMARFPLRHHFAFGMGMVSDDTDHNIFVAQALIRSRGNVAEFRSCLAWRLRLWLLCLPAGIGLATLRGIIRLWLGFSRSGVFSAGNGPSMRSAIIGAAFPADARSRRLYVEASTLLTHTDPKALAGALAIAELAARLAAQKWVRRPDVNELVAVLTGVSSEPEWLAAVEAIRELCASSAMPVATMERFGSRSGVSGYTLHTVPFVIVVWYRHFGDYRATIESVVRAGGDVDTVAAIAGALAGITVGTSGIPADWVNGLVDYPHSVTYMRGLAAAFENPASPAAPASSRVSTGFSPWLFPRGLVFTMLVLAHGFRRLLPPY